MANAPQKASGPTVASTSAAVEKPGGEKARNVLTEGMPQPPGVVERRRRRITRKRRQGPFVKYVGHASFRTISATEWNALGLEDKPKDGFSSTSWDLNNDFLVESSKFTDEQLDYLLIDDRKGDGTHSFLEVDYDNDGQLVQVPEDEDDED